MAFELTSENKHAAKMILDHPLIRDIFDTMEETALNNAVNAKPLDHELVAAFLAEVRAIRNLQKKLEYVVSNAPNMSDRK